MSRTENMYAAGGGNRLIFSQEDMEYSGGFDATDSRINDRGAGMPQPERVLGVPMVIPKAIIIRNLMSTGVRTGIDVFMNNLPLESVISSDSLKEMAIDTAVGAATDYFLYPALSPIVGPMLPSAIQPYYVPLLNAGVVTGMKYYRQKVMKDQMIMEFFYNVGSNVLADTAYKSIYGYVGDVRR